MFLVEARVATAITRKRSKTAGENTALDTWDRAQQIFTSRVDDIDARIDHVGVERCDVVGGAEAARVRSGLQNQGNPG